MGLSASKSLEGETQSAGTLTSKVRHLPLSRALSKCPCWPGTQISKAWLVMASLRGTRRLALRQRKELVTRTNCGQREGPFLKQQAKRMKHVPPPRSSLPEFPSHPLLAELTRETAGKEGTGSANYQPNTQSRF